MSTTPFLTRLSRWAASTIITLGVSLGSVSNANAQMSIPDMSCPNEFSSILGNLCLSCIFPMRVGVQIGGGGSGRLPSDKYSAICACRTRWPPFVRIGVTSGGWLPEGIIETTPFPYCSSSLGGIDLDGDNSGDSGIGKWADTTESFQHAFYHAHYIPFPIGEVADLLVDFACGTGSTTGLSVGLWSELDPTWDEGELAMLKSPTYALVDGAVWTGLIGTCSAEYLAMQTSGNYTGTIAGCAGVSGPLYPLTGHVSNSGNPAFMTQLISMRLLDTMYKLRMQGKTWGSNSYVCRGSFNAQDSIPKSGHQFQQVAPGAGESRNHRLGDHWTTPLSGAVPLTIPGLGPQGHEINNNSYIYINWKYKECCVL